MGTGVGVGVFVGVLVGVAVGVAVAVGEDEGVGVPFPLSDEPPQATSVPRAKMRVVTISVVFIWFSNLFVSLICWYG